MPMPLIDLTGQRFGRLTVVERAGASKNREALWKCRCDCGNMVVVRSRSLRRGSTASCGCLGRETLLENIHRSKTHGHSKDRLYRTWTNMRQRCNNPKAQFYAKYGGRGIKVCVEWDHDFLAFYDWAMAHGYQENLTIDRIDNDKGYSPENCRWVTQKQQNDNRSNSLRFTIGEEEKTLSEWCRHYKISKKNVWDRLQRGWTIEEALEIVKRE